MDRRPSQHLNADTAFLNDPAAQALCAALEGAGHKDLVVGGCVRNAILGVEASDIDISTDAMPQDVTRIAEHAGFRAVPTGIEHGTVTVVANDMPFEVTTFRRDVATDGRRAVVAFSKDITDDARRRDFTMNALYADRNGAVIDPLQGLPDLEAGRVRFIEDAGQRIREDYLRTLRFFRFHAYYANQAEGWDYDALSGIAQHLDGLETLSGERVGAEMTKLLAAPDPAPALAVMMQTGVLGVVLPGADPMLAGPLVHLERMIGVAPDPITRLAALGGVDAATRLRLSRADQKLLGMIRDQSTSMLSPKAIGYMVGPRAGLGAVLLRGAMANTPLAPAIIAEVRAGSQSDFPVKASDLPDLQGKALGDRLKVLKQVWFASDLSKSKNDLLGS